MNAVGSVLSTVLWTHFFPLCCVWKMFTGLDQAMMSLMFLRWRWRWKQPSCWDEVAQHPFSFWGGDTLWWLLYPVKTAVWFDSSKTFLFYFCLKWLWMQSKRCFSDWTGFVDIHAGGWRECRDKHTAAELCKWAVVTLSCSSSSVI